MSPDDPGVWYCVCGMAWTGRRGDSGEVRSHSDFRISGGEPGANHDPGLATFRADAAPRAATEPLTPEELASPYHVHECPCGEPVMEESAGQFLADKLAATALTRERLAAALPGAISAATQATYVDGASWHLAIADVILEALATPPSAPLEETRP